MEIIDDLDKAKNELFWYTKGDPVSQYLDSFLE